MQKLLTALFATGSLLLSCDHSKKADDPHPVCCGPNVLDLSAGLDGTWLLYERGYSPGAGYITEDVALQPPQTMVFKPDSSFSSNIGTLKEFKFYRVIPNPQSNSYILALFSSDPGSGPHSVDQLKHSYAMEREGYNLKLYYRYCFEGCHIALSKVSTGG